MAKKKTDGPDISATPPAATRRRTSTKRPSGNSAGPTVTERESPVPVVHSADDMASSTSNGSDTYKPSYEEIAEAAYQRYLSRGGEHGRDWDDWIDAERDLRSRRHAG